MIDFNIKKNEDLNLYECTMTATLPPITCDQIQKVS